MKKVFRGALSVPNLITYFRLLLIPAFVLAYFAGRYVWALVILAASALSDVADGYIARHYGMVTDVGRIVDPLADKLTQGAVIFCAAWRNPIIWGLFAALVVKEMTMLIFSVTAFRRTGAHSSKWYGKLCTAVLYASMAAFVLFPELPSGAVWAIIAVCGAVLLLSLVMYIRYFMQCVREDEAKEAAAAADEREESYESAE